MLGQRPISLGTGGWDGFGIRSGGPTNEELSPAFTSGLVAARKKKKGLCDLAKKHHSQKSCMVW